MAQCPQCQSNIPEGNSRCNYCGYQLQPIKQPPITGSAVNTRAIKMVLLSIIVFSVISFLANFFIYRSSQKLLNLAADNGSNLNLECVNSSDCQVPMEYAVQSNCPYQAYCHDYQCVVGCPMWQEPADPDQPGFSYNVPCEKATDCDCTTWDTENKYECACLDNQCAAIVAEIE